MKIGEVLFRYRTFFPIPFFLFLLWKFKPVVVSFCAGIFLIICGALLRVWTQRYTGEWSRGNSIGGERIIKEGPFSVVRHPLYLANFIIGSGYVVLSGYRPLVVFLVYCVLFGLYYGLIILSEERYFMDRFGEEYQDYRKKVPAIIPVFKGFLKGSPNPWLHGFKREVSSILTNVLLVVIFAGRWFWRL